MLMTCRKKLHRDALGKNGQSPQCKAIFTLMPVDESDNVTAIIDRRVAKRNGATMIPDPELN